VSESEAAFIREGIAQGIRNDGRSNEDFRFFTLQAGQMMHANGSSRLKLDDTDIMVGINMEIGEPDVAEPEFGRVVCSVDCAASASPEFAGRGAEALNIELTSALEQILVDSNIINLRDLCIIPDQQCWVLYIDVLVLDSSGNLLDAIVMAVRAALMVTSVPSVQVVEGPNREKQIEVSDDPYNSKPFRCDDVPLCVSFIKVADEFIVDPTLQEEDVMAARITVAVNRMCHVCSMHKAGVGGVAPEALQTIIARSKPIAADLFQRLHSLVNQEDEQIR